MSRRHWIGLVLVGVAGGMGALAVAHAQDSGQKPSVPVPVPATQPAEGQSPHLELSPTDFEFGEIWQGMAAKREFSIKNSGTAPLTITATSSCGCTVPTTPKSPLAPGEASTFTITYDTNRTGPAQKKVTLTTNDPARREVDIKVQGSVKPLFQTDPSETLMFDDIETTSIETQTIRLTNKFDQPLNLKLKPDQDFGPFDVALKEIKPGAQYELVVTTRPPLRLGSNRGTALVETGLEKSPTLTFRLFGNAQPRVLATPPTILAIPEVNQQEVKVQYRKTKPVKITAIKTIPDSIKFELLPSEPPLPQSRVAFHRIRVTLPPYEQLPAEGSRIEIYTDDPSEEYQKLTVTVLKRTGPPRSPVPAQQGAQRIPIPEARPGGK